MKRVFAIIAALAAIFASRPAFAHDVKGEIVFLDVGEHAVAIELQIPITQLRAVQPAFFPGPDHDIASLTLDRVPAFVSPRLFGEDRDGHRFETAVESARIDGNAVVVEATFHGDNVRYFTFHDDVVLGGVVTHSAYVFLRRDLRSGDMGESPTLIGELHWQNRSLIVDRDAGGRLSVVRNALGLGIHHIAEGTDHILFLLMLLLALAKGSARQAAIGTAKIVTAFTIGHSISLAAASILHFQSGNAIEILIALSILVTAIHAVRPIFPGREPLVAAGFGLVHGLAFASALMPFGFDRTTLTLSLLGFNLGVEAMQLAIVLVAAPIFTLLSGVRMFRIAGGIAGGVAAFGFALQIRVPVATLAGAVVVTVLVDRLSRERPAPI